MELTSRGMKKNRGGHLEIEDMSQDKAWKWHPAPIHHVGASMLLLQLGRDPGKLMERGREIGLSREAGPSVGLHQGGPCRPPQETRVLPCSIAKLCLTLGDPMDCRVPSFPVLHYFPEFVQTHVYRVSDAIQPSRPLCCPLFFIHNYCCVCFCYVLSVCSHCLDPHFFFVYATLLKKNKSIATRAITWSLIHWQLASSIPCYIKQCVGR